MSSAKKRWVLRDGKLVPGRARPWGQDGRVGGKASLHFTSQQLPTWHQAAPRWNHQGQAQFQSYKEIREFEAKARDMGEDWSYNEA